MPVEGMGGDASLELWVSAGDAPPVRLPSTTRRTPEGSRAAFLVTPDAPLTVGTTVELRGEVCPEFAGLGEVSVVYRVVDRETALPAPPLRLETRVVGYASDGFFSGFEGLVDLHVDGGDPLEDWYPWVTPQLLLDGSPIELRAVSGRSAQGSFQMACRTRGGAEPGLHTVTGSLRTLDGASLGSLEEARDFDCATARFYTGPGGRELSEEEVSALRDRPHDTGKGGCRAGGGGPTSGVALLLFALLLGAPSRRA